MAEFPAPARASCSPTSSPPPTWHDHASSTTTCSVAKPSWRASRPSSLANSWIIINVGGGPTEDKPAVILEPPAGPDRVSAFLNIRVTDIQAVYRDWTARGAQFLTPPIDRGPEIRCYLRDPDNHLIEVGQSTR